MSYYNLPDPRQKKPKKRIQKVIGENGDPVDGPCSNPNPYCTSDTQRRLDLQNELKEKLVEALDRKLKREMGWRYRPDIAAASIEREMAMNRVGLSTIKKLLKRTWCDVCGKHVENIEADWHGWNHWYRFRIHCHGQQQDFEVTQSEYVYVLSKQKTRAYAFLDSQRELERQWVDRLLAERPRRLLLQFAGANQKRLCYTPWLHDTGNIGCISPGTVLNKQTNPDWVKATYVVHHWHPTKGFHTVSGTEEEIREQKEREVRQWLEKANQAFHRLIKEKCLDV